MKLSSFATAGLIAFGVGILGGCASTPTAQSEPSWDIGNRPQMLMPGAVRADVKGLAMGAARSKGWTILKSTEDRLVVQRPVDPGSAAAAAVGVAASAIPPVIEVTSAFVQRSDGVLVALGAELVSQPPGEKSPVRVDYTESYRDALNRSLESLRSNWAANRQRVASSTPSEAVRAEAEAERAEAGAASTNPLVKVWAETLEEEKASKGASTGAARTSPPSPAAPPTPPSPPEPAAGTRLASPAPSAAPVAPSTPAPAAPTRGAGPAPIVEGNIALRGGATGGGPGPVTGTVLPPVPVESVPSEQNMLTLNQSGSTGTWAYYAEQYARLRGCDVSDEGAVLIESRSDSEIHKVPCRSADSFLVKCQNGVCRGLE
ncbi:MAG: hypothetical protein ACM3ST_13440 [Bdellovibrio bacteriovorus]